MNRKGFIFTLDATLSFIPIFLLLVSASSLAPSTSFGSVRFLRMNQFAQDSMVVLSDKMGNNSSPLESYLNASATTSIDNFLQNSSTQWNYLLQMNTPSGWVNMTGRYNISNFDISGVTTSFDNADDIAVAVKVVTNSSEGNSALHLFRMNVWG